jgi:HlyD family secretion protein
MDIPRESFARQKKIRRIILGIVGLALIAGVTYGLSQLKPAAPTVDRGALWFGTVERGEMLREVRGLGTLVPEEIRWIPAQTQGRVEERLIQPGTSVGPNSVIMRLSNPELEQSALDAELQLKAAEADFANLKVQLDTDLLNLQAAAATVKSDYNQARLQADVDEQLFKEGLQSDLLLKRSRLRAEELKTRWEIEQQRLEIRGESVRARLAAQKAQVDQRRALYDLRRSQLESLNVRAGMEGVLQQLAVEVGEQVSPGTRLARVANPKKLKAEIRIAETTVKDVAIGQLARVDTRSAIIPGRVVRIDPAAQSGTFTVDIALEGPLPAGARPDVSVDGTIELERLVDVLYVNRPVQGQPNATITLFKLVEGGSAAERVQVKFGRSSVSTIEVIEGLKVGDSVILTDMSAQDGVNRIRIRG